MTVSGIAHSLGKKVLSVNLELLRSSDPDKSQAGDLQGIFREASVNNAVIFFDECENVFASRRKGSNDILNKLLTEIEKYEGIVFLATNLPQGIF